MNTESIAIKIELYPKLVFIQKMSDKYFDNLMSDFDINNRKEFIAGHEFYIQYVNEYIECNIWTDCDNYSIQFIDLYRIDDSKNVRIDFLELDDSKQIRNLYAESSKGAEPLTKTFVEEYLKRESEYEVLNKPLKEYYETKGEKLIEQNFILHAELFKKHPGLFSNNSEIGKT